MNDNASENKSNSKKSNTDTSDGKKKNTILMFVLFLLMCGLSGGLLGFFSSDFFQSDFSLSKLVPPLDIASWILTGIFLAVMVTIVLLMLIFLKKGKALFSEWDGEDEEIPEKAGNILSKGILTGNAGIIADMILLDVLVYFLTLDKNDTINSVSFIISMVCYFTILICTLFMQRSMVQLYKSNNPEKRGELFSLTFKKDWHNSMDEGERLIAYKAAYKAFGITSTACCVIWTLSILSQMIFGEGFWMGLVAAVIWVIMIITYCAEVARLERK